MGTRQPAKGPNVADFNVLKLYALNKDVEIMK